jgi:hypothetical protein
MTARPGLELFLGGYLHQDWFDDYHGDVWGAVEDFARSEPEDAPLIGTEIEALLASGMSEHQLRTLIVDELDGQYWLEDDDPETYRAWLTEVAARVDQILKAKQIEGET